MLIWPLEHQKKITYKYPAGKLTHTVYDSWIYFDKYSSQPRLFGASDKFQGVGVVASLALGVEGLKYGQYNTTCMRMLSKYSWTNGFQLTAVHFTDGGQMSQGSLSLLFCSMLFPDNQESL